MKNIKFRGKDDCNGDWIFGYPLRDSDIKDRWYIMNNYSDGIIIDAKTLGQFTGLTDKNGKEIYEGDIIQIHEGRDDFKITAIEWNVKYALFIPTNKNLRYELNSEYSVKYYEIIGNIHDNPSLLTNKD